MPPEQWDRVRELFHRALDLPPEARPHFLKDRCSDDAIRAEVETLLRGAQETQGTLDRPALEDARAAVHEVWSKSASAPLVPGSRLGSYEVLAPLGAGGMGEV